jgi:chemotaxis protein MotB
MSIMFVLMVFIVAESYLDDALTQRTRDAQGLRQQLCTLTHRVNQEREENHRLNLAVSQISHELMASKENQKDLQDKLGSIGLEQEGAVHTIEELKQLVYSLYQALDPQASPEEEGSPSPHLSPLEQEKYKVASLKEKINLTLAQRVEELEKYRSEFFGQLRQTLGEHPDLKIVGDRFVVQSEVLFASGSAQIGEEGQRQLEKIGKSLREITAKIPQTIPWILRIDGHTDTVPIRTAAFRSNWELSAARAISVVNFLIQQGVPPHRLAATGFGEFQPLESDGSSPKDHDPLRHHRRIELKLDQR